MKKYNNIKELLEFVKSEIVFNTMYNIYSGWVHDKIKYFPQYELLLEWCSKNISGYAGKGKVSFLNGTKRPFGMVIRYDLDRYSYFVKIAVRKKKGEITIEATYN